MDHASTFFVELSLSIPPEPSILAVLILFGTRQISSNLRLAVSLPAPCFSSISLNGGAYFLSCQQDGDQEEVLTTIVGTLLLRALKAWKCGDSSTQLAWSPQIVPVVSRILDLGLDNCWSKTSSLRQCQMKIIVAFMENKMWRHFLSTCPSETERTSMDIMAPILSVLEHPQSQQLHCCEVLSLVTQVLQTPRFRSSHPYVKNPFMSRTERPEELECALAAEAFPLVLAKLDDRSYDVRLKAIQTLGDLLPFVQPDCTGRQRPNSEVDGHLHAENITNGTMAPATIPNCR